MASRRRELRQRNGMAAWLAACGLACSAAPEPAAPPLVDVAPSPVTIVAAEPEATDPAPEAPKPIPAGAALDARCPLDEAVGNDLNGDGQPDVFEVERDGRLFCRAMDFDMNGAVDMTEIYDASGAVAVRLVDVDGDGSVDLRTIHDASGCRQERDGDGDGVFEDVRPC